MSGPSPDLVRTLVGLACRAPSVHNTQPWRWSSGPEGLDLFADTQRKLEASDPRGRNLMVSCGAALHHAQVVAGALGWQGEVIRHPSGPDTDHLARLVLRPAPVEDEAPDVLRSVRERRTDRRRLTSWPVPDALLHEMARTASAWGVHAVPLVDVTARFRVDQQVARARDRQSRDPQIAAEQRTWVDHGPLDGIPSTVLPSVPDSSPVAAPTRFEAGLLDDHLAELETSDGLVLLCGYADAAPDWLRTGESLSALWLRATLDGLSVVPLTQPIEVEETRMALMHDVLGGLAIPHLVVRLGWQALSRSELAPTPRRPLDEVLSIR